MRKRTKGAIVVLIGLLVAFTVISVFDYTHTYVSDRFTKAVDGRRYTAGEPFSLDAFMEYYDWDTVCIVTPDSDMAFETRVGFDYKHQAGDGQSWSLLFLKGESVEAEISIQRSFLAYPNGLEKHCFERWEAMFSIDTDENGMLRLYTVGG